MSIRTTKQEFTLASDIIRKLRIAARRAPLKMPAAFASAPPWMAELLPKNLRPERAQAVALALRFFGAPDQESDDPDESLLLDHAMLALVRLPAMTDIAELALRVGPQFVMHAMRPSAVHTVHTTDLHGLPGEPPRLLHRVCVLESDLERDKVLFGKTVCLGAAPLPDGRIMLIGFEIDGAAIVAFWAPQWGEREILTPDDAPLLLDGGIGREEHVAWGKQAARFLVVLGLLLEAEGTPLVHRDEGGKTASGHKPKAGEGWTVRHVQLGAAGPSTPPTSGGGGGGPGEGVEGREAAQVAVRGHLKRQRHGPGHSQVKTIYVAGYAARRWVAPEVEVRVN